MTSQVDEHAIVTWKQFRFDTEALPRNEKKIHKRSTKYYILLSRGENIFLKF